MTYEIEMAVDGIREYCSTESNMRSGEWTFDVWAKFNEPTTSPLKWVYYFDEEAVI